MRNDARLPLELNEVVAHLRQTPDVRQDWLNSVVHRVATQQVERPVVRVAWRFTSWIPAAAAAVLCIAVGSGGTYVALGRRAPSTEGSPASVAASASSRSPQRFVIVAPSAASVHLVGDFNEWDPVALPMRRRGNGSAWEVEVPLAPGHYTYAFVVDGKLARDPSAAQAAGDDFGSPSSVLLVRANGT
jgi:Carbohydrate-binding module 48 (Isoamylase N-terminal domain)